jgi:hypothetical protein
MSNTDFRAKRVSRSYCQTINANPNIVFPLLCPVREAEWLDEWSYNLIYSESGVAEEGCVFSTAYKGEKDTIWIITEHNKEKKLVEFTRVTPESRASILSISVKTEKKNTSNVYIKYTYTAICEEGNKFIDEFTEDAFLAAVKFWEKSMNYFLRTGKQLKHAK